MNTTTSLRRALLCVTTVLALSTTGCESQYEEVPGGCVSTPDCPLTQVCNRLESTCEPEPYNRFMGSFSCTLTATTATNSGNVGYSDVLGWFDFQGRDMRYTFNQFASCSFIPEGGIAVFLFGQGVTGEYRTFMIKLPVPSAGAHALIPTGQAKSEPDQGTAAVGVKYPTQADYTEVLDSTDGFVFLGNEASVGGELSGYIDANVRVVLK